MTMFNGKTLAQWLYSNSDRKTFLTQWQSNIQYGMTDKQFCESLIKYGDTNSKLIGQTGLDNLTNGIKLPKTLKGWFPETVIAGIEVSVNAGDRMTGVSAAIKELDGGHNVIAKLIGVLAFPFFLCVGGSMLGVYVSSELSSAITVENSSGKMVHDLFVSFGLPIVILLLTLLFSLSLALPKWSGASRQYVNNFPLFSLYKNATLGSFLDSLGNLISCNMNLDEALAAIEPHSSPFMRKHIEVMREQRIGEDNLGVILDTGLFIPIALSPLKVLGSTAEFSGLLFKSAAAHKEAAEKSMKRMSSIMPKAGIAIAIACLGALIGSSISDLMTVI